MTNLPANRQGSQVAERGPDYNPYTEYANANSTRNIVGTLLKFSKGDFRYGDASKIMPMGTRLVGDPAEIMVGMIKWEDGKPAEHIMGRVGDGFVAPKRRDLDETDESQWPVMSGKPQDPWQRGNYLVLMSETDGEIYTFATGSKGGSEAIIKLIGSFGRAFRSKAGQLPLIELGWSEYEHDEYSWIKKPVLKIVGWVPREAFDKAMGAETEASQADEEQTRLPIDEPQTKAATPETKAAAAKAKNDSRPQF